VFSFISLIFSSLYIYVFDPFLVDFCIGWEIEVKFQSFAYGHLVSPAQFIEKDVLSPMYVFVAFVKNQLAEQQVLVRM
jgi:hypothetical protein